jgi:uncharacterized protein YjiS (DUF1127 family)
MQLLHSSIASVGYCASAAFDYLWINETQTRQAIMAYYNDIAKRDDLIARALGATARILNTAAERRAQRRIFHSTLVELTALSDRELADLGMHRSELNRIAWESAYAAQAH